MIKKFNMNIVKNRKIYFIITGVTAIISILFILIFGLKLSIDFTGGSRLNLQIENSDKTKIENSLKASNLSQYTINIDEENVLIRTSQLSLDAKNKIVESIKKDYPAVVENNFDTIGPTIGNETQWNAFKAVGVASVAITLYIAFAFRQVSKPVKSWKYGVTAIVTLLHDVIVVIGLFALFGVIFGVEVDGLFITAMLTVMGFSVHDTIVVFDKIRENLRKNLDLKFEDTVNNAILETLNRSLNTSITIAIVLISLILFGGESIRWFIIALFIGIVVGTYSSIFVAAQMLVAWNEWDKNKKEKVKGEKSKGFSVLSRLKRTKK